MKCETALSEQSFTYPRLISGISALQWWRPVPRAATSSRNSCQAIGMVSSWYSIKELIVVSCVYEVKIGRSRRVGQMLTI